MCEPDLPSVDVVVLDRGAALEEKAIVLGVVDGPRGIVPRERTDGVHALPQRERDDLGRVTSRPVQDPGPSVAGGRPVVLDSGPANVLDIFGSVLGSHETAPDPGDHESFPEGVNELMTRRSARAGRIRAITASCR